MDAKKEKRIKIAIIVLAILLGLSLLTLAGTLIYQFCAENTPTSVVIPENIIRPEGGESQAPSDATTDDSKATEPTQIESQPEMTAPTQVESQPEMTAPTQEEILATALRLHSKNAEDNTPFYAVNLFPGDRETKYYCIQVTHKDTVTVRFRADIQRGHEKLAEVLKTKVVLKNTGAVLFDGLMRDMPESINHILETEKSTVNELYYEITTYLETSVGNEYMEKELKADFRWWVEETGNLDSPQTEDPVNLMFWLVMMFVSLGAVILLIVRHRVEVARNAVG